MTRRLLWVSLPDQRPRRELYWMTRMAHTEVTALAASRPEGELSWVPSSYVRPVTRFVEAGALAWVRGMARQEARDFDWVASLELCSLVTGQASSWRSKAQRRGVPVKQAVITWENLPDQPLYRIPPYRRAVESSRSADLLLCMVDAARDHLVRLDFDEDRIRVVKPGVDTELFRPAAAPVEKPVAAFVSPLAENKGIDRVLQAMRIVRAELPEAELVVAGRGPLEALVAEAGADPRSGVRYLGSLDTAGVASALRSAALFVTAPRPTWKWTEQLGLAYLEAMASGLPVVTTRCGTNDEAVTDVNSLVPDKVDALAESLLEWLCDPRRRAEVGRMNREHIERHHDLATQCARMGDAFASIEGD